MFDVFNTPVLYIRQREVPLGFVDVFNIIQEGGAKRRRGIFHVSNTIYKAAQSAAGKV
jgi:hypothetical protein